MFWIYHIIFQVLCALIQTYLIRNLNCLIRRSFNNTKTEPSHSGSASLWFLFVYDASLYFICMCDCLKVVVFCTLHTSSWHLLRNSIHSSSPTPFSFDLGYETWNDSCSPIFRKSATSFLIEKCTNKKINHWIELYPITTGLLYDKQNANIKIKINWKSLVENYLQNIHTLTFSSFEYQPTLSIISCIYFKLYIQRTQLIWSVRVYTGTFYWALNWVIAWK